MTSMPPASQRPILNKLLECDPLDTPLGTFYSIDAALGVVPYQILWAALTEHGIEVDIRTLQRWRKDLRETA